MSRKASREHPDARPVEAALRRMRLAVSQREYDVHPRVFDRLLELRLAHHELLEAVEIAMEEITAADYKAPDRSFDPPGHGFVWLSKRFGCRMYLKFRLEGSKPRCWLYSFRKADY